MYAIIRINKKQYKVSVGDEILVDKLADKAKPEAEVLMISEDEKTQIGTPILSSAKVLLKVLGEEKGKKIHVFKFKSKSRYRRKIGSRPQFTRILVEKIS